MKKGDYILKLLLIIIGIYMFMYVAGSLKLLYSIFMDI